MVSIRMAKVFENRMGCAQAGTFVALGLAYPVLYSSRSW